MSTENLRFVAFVVLVTIGTAVTQQGAVAQQQQEPQKPKLHGFKARLCGMTTVPYSPAWDNCMAAGFGKPHPKQPPQPAAAVPQQVASTPQQVAPPQPKLQEPIVNGTPVQTPVQGPVQAKTCIEYMTTSSGAQTCLRWKDDQNQ
jgi:hypothetical protein